MTQNNDMEAVKKFLEWYNQSKWEEDTIEVGSWFNVMTSETITTDKLLDIYESETRMYDIGEIWDEMRSVRIGAWEEVDEFDKHILTAFAERYHELKTQWRIKS